jgi:hypothetical protein|tara:strand:+ start:87 stop:770 length:684 start_codon:yes stop_codon:yes gene_type:complete
MNTLPYEERTFSQHGEDGILKFLLTFIDDKNKNFLEIGWGDGRVNCCRNLLENLNFSGTGVDAKTSKISHSNLKTISQFISLDDVDFLISLEGKEPTIFSLDIDSFDWHLLKSMLSKGFLPKIICHEYNSILGPDHLISRKYGKNIKYDKRHLFGASLLAFKKILEKNYNFVTVDSSGVNAFWIRKDIEFTHPAQYYDFNFFKSVKERIYDNGLENFLNLDDGWEYV